MIVSKYHGLGNDFVITNINQVQGHDLSQLAITLCDRRTSLGADGLIVFDPSNSEMIFYNQDGSRASMCGNGIRCLSHYVLQNNFIDSDQFTINTLDGPKEIKTISKNPFIFEVNMGVPSFTPSSYFSTSNKEYLNESIIVKGKKVTFSSLHLGVPHTVVEVEELIDFDMVEVGHFLHTSKLFKQGTNVNFYHFVDNNHIKMQTYERGVGLTLACGTGASSVFAYLRKTNQVDEEIKVSLPLGNLTLREKCGHIFMEGPSELVYETEVLL